jgi:NADH:ubiquinone oxidoreductase subunit H
MSSTYSILVTVAGLVTKNKYASYSSTRVILVGITLEILIMFLMILLAIVSETLSFAFA